MPLPCSVQHDGDVCKLIGRAASRLFCAAVCKGEWQKWKAESLESIRTRLRKPVEDAGGLVSVIIPVENVDAPYLSRTVDSVKGNAGGEVEVLTEYDEGRKGHRVLMNRMAARAKGEYLFRLDAHCALSPEWDLRLKTSCRPGVLVSPITDGLDSQTWLGTGRDMGLMVLTPEMRNTVPGFWKPITKRKIEEETLSFHACAYMVRRDDFGDGCDESLGPWGAGGLEWALKFWLTGKKVLVRTDTVCYHLFRPDGKIPYMVDPRQVDNAFKMLAAKWGLGRGEGQTRTLAWLAKRFERYLKANVRVAASNRPKARPADTIRTG